MNPGGVPIFKNGQMVGGIGVAGVDPLTAEYAAFTATQINFDGVFDNIAALPPPGEVVIDGIALPFVQQTTAPAVNTPGTFSAANYIQYPIDSAGPPPEGYLIPATNGPLGGLTTAQVNSIIMNAVATAMQTRALIRLPVGVARGNVDRRQRSGRHHHRPLPHDRRHHLQHRRRRHQSPQRSLFQRPHPPAAGSQSGADRDRRHQSHHWLRRPSRFSRPGINGTQPGPFFNIFTQDVANPCTQGFQVPSASWPAINQSGIVFFPGSDPLYVNGQLVGGLGVCGDGVDQDDYVTSGGAVGFEAPASIQADQIMIDGVRLPYLHFPRNPTQ